MNNLIIAPSVLSANFASLGADIQMLNNSAAEWIHIDVMDGVFVPNISFGFPVIDAIKKLTTKFLDVHLMIEKPERYIQSFANSGANMITVHWEACTHIHRTIQEIKNAGCQAGIALNPGTPVHVLVDLLHEIDLVLIMSVNPGFGGQLFIENTIQKTKSLCELILSKNVKSPMIEIDGGVSDENAQSLFSAGAHVLVAGNYIFKSTQPQKAIQTLLDLGK